MADKTISILLTKRKDRFSKLIYWITGRKYTHASIRLDDMGQDFYGFTLKGLRRESFEWLVGDKTSNYVLYPIQVKQEVYDKACCELNTCLENRKLYHYNLIGAILCLLHIPIKIKNFYFCSQFVAEILMVSGAVELKCRPTLCLPNTLDKELHQYCAPENIIMRLNTA